MTAVVVAQYVTALAGLAVLAAWAIRVRGGRDPLGPRPEGPLADTGVTVLCAVPAWLVASFALAAIAQRVGLGPAGQAAATARLHALIGLAILPFVRRGAPSPRVGAARLACIGLAAGAVTFGVANGLLGEAVRVAYAMTGVNPPEQAVVGVVRAATGAEWADLLVTTVVLAPYGEEVFWRGALLPALARRTSPGAAVVLQGLAFGAIHVVGAPPSAWPLALPLAAVGVLAGWVYVRTASIHAAFLLHAVFNGLNLAFLRLGAA